MADQPVTLDDHVERVASAAAAHNEALANPARTISVPTDDGPYEMPLSLITARRVDEARHDAMGHLAGNLAAGYAAAQAAAEADPSDANRAEEQRLALELQGKTQAVRDAHGQPGFRVAGDAVRG